MRLLYILIFGLIVLISCKKFVDVGPPSTQLTGEVVFSSDITATSAMLGVYADMEADGLAYNMILIAGTCSDECINYRTSVDAINIATNNILPESGGIGSLWNNFYNYVYQCNAIIEGLERSGTVSAAIKKQLKGEALFVRSWCHYYLAALFNNVPYITVTDYQANAVALQKKSEDIYPLLVTDLQHAKELLGPGYVNVNGSVGGERIRANKWAASALLARILLYTKDWSSAELQCDSILAQPGMYALGQDLTTVFLKNNVEAIWQLQAVRPQFNSFPGAVLQPTTSTPTLVTLTRSVSDSFQQGDKRKQFWTKQIVYNNQTYNWAHKYKVGQNAPAITEYTMMLRLAEVYLVRAEARAMQDKFTGANQDINAIRLRAGITTVNLLSRAELLTRIYEERKQELFMEFGDRWLTLKRTGLAPTVMPLSKGANWVDTDQWYPIPLNQMLRNPFMQQNPGY